MQNQPPNIRLCVFDAYGTLFDVNSAARQAAAELGEKWAPLAELWRTKQLQYSWLRALMGRHADFWQVTGDALDFALESLRLRDDALRGRLMDLYLRLHAFPEVQRVLTRLKAAGQRTAILSNGAPRMLSAAAQNAGIEHLLDAILSVEEVGIYKPHPSVYRLAIDRFHCQPRNVCFVSSNAWDAYAAKAFGFNVAWCNRARQLPERLPEKPDWEIATLEQLPEVIGVAG